MQLLRWLSIPRAVSSKNRWMECNIHYFKECFKQGKEPKVYDVVEIDDGIKPAFFYKTEHGYELLFSFDAKTAKKIIMEEID